MAASRILVICYSRTGTTRAVAKSLTAVLHCDSEEIVEDRSGRGMLGGAVRDVVGIWSGAASDIVKLSDYAARSIG